jgi:hypothetical protein
MPAMKRHEGSDSRLRRGRKLLRFPSRSRASGDDQAQQPSVVELYGAIGHIAVNWSSVEIASGFVLMELVGSHDEALAQAVVAGQRVENVWETIEALLTTFGPEAVDALEEFRSWRRRANLQRRRRNEVIHSAWSLADSNGRLAAIDLMSRRAKRGARSDLFPEGVPQLEQLARDIAVLEDRLLELQDEFVVIRKARE